MSLSKTRTDKEYQQFVENELKTRGLDIPPFFMDVYAKLTNVDTHG